MTQHSRELVKVEPSLQGTLGTVCLGFHTVLEAVYMSFTVKIGPVLSVKVQV